MGESSEYLSQLPEKKSIWDVLGLSDLKNVFLKLRDSITGKTKQEAEELKKNIQYPVSHENDAHEHHSHNNIPGRSGKQDRRIESLEDDFEKRFSAAMHEYNSTYSPKIFIVESGRTKEDQAAYVAS
jgi:hypothetical protein